MADDKGGVKHVVPAYQGPAVPEGPRAAGVACGPAQLGRWVAQVAGAMAVQRDRTGVCQILVDRLAAAVEADVLVIAQYGVIAAAPGPVSAPVAEPPGEGHRLLLSVPGSTGSAVARLVLRRTSGPALSRTDVDLAQAAAAALEVALDAVMDGSGEVDAVADGAPAVLPDPREAQRLLDWLSVVQHAIARRAPLQEIFDAVTAGAQALLGDEFVALAMPDSDNPQLLQLASTRGFPDEVLRRLWSTPVAAGGVTGLAMQRGELVVFDRYAENPFALQDGVDARIRTAMAAPVLHDGRVLGSLFVASRNPDRRYESAERAVLTAFAARVGVAIEAARAVDGLHHAFHDALTGLASRALLTNRLAHALAWARRRGERVAVLLVDLHRFHVINDSAGHTVGDAVLASVGRRLREMVRQTDTVARFGGDEFAILLPGVVAFDEVISLVHRVLDTVAQPVPGDAGEVRVSCHVGVAFSDIGSAGEEQLLQGADLALMAAKQGGQGGYEVFQPAMQTAFRDRTRLESDLRHALDRGELEVHYQPIVDLRRGAVAGCEALLRWRHPERGLVPPLRYIDLAEQNGCILPIGRWVLQVACRQVAQWNGFAGQEPLYVAVNLSGRQLQHPTIADDVAAVLHESALPADRLVLELTESVLLDDLVTTRQRLHALKLLGVRLAVDDFGTGYSSLAYLRHFPMDLLKVDKLFIDDLVRASEAAGPVRGIVQLAHTMGLSTVAEGIENDEQLAALRDSDCEYGQGYHFAKPLPATDFAELVFGGGALTGGATMAGLAD